ncbi:hypothetical protein [Marinobacter sp. F4218]|uniref:hypothetical protein n=1 Tax=Marinobacter sp. F4218 TaxID=2862868 RepID=UPI001C634D5F|nr:hypothetical protein [Marinobacter sp. F4218]MBW7469476.1 hypothetical protein [Marinobacter sp. F4218]
MDTGKLIFLASFMAFAALTFWFNLFAAHRIRPTRKREHFLANLLWFFERDSFRENDKWIRWVGALLNVSFWGTLFGDSKNSLSHESAS